MDGLLKFVPRPTGVGDVFQLLRDGRPRTRADLAAVTGHARSTIGQRIDLLLSSGLVTPTGEATSTGGRPPATFAFAPGSRIVLAVDLGAVHAQLAVTDLAGEVLVEQSARITISDGPDTVLDWVAEAGRELLARSGRPSEDLVGVGVGVPGPVEHATGRPWIPPIMPGWDGADIAGRLRRAFRVPVLVDNDVNLMALGEHSAVYPQVEHLLFVKVATGIGAGIVSDGGLRRGAQGAAGDLGHMAVPGGETVPCTCGNTGCLEALASGGAIVLALRHEGLDVDTSAGVVELVRAGDATAIRLVRQAGRDLGAVLAGCVSLLNPSIIVIGGIVAQAGEHLLAGIREVVYQRSLPLATQHLRIVTTHTQGRAAVLGASRMVADHVLAPAAIDALFEGVGA
ncbi:MAG: ROK family transcriptional regulator [Actinomycetales bacterium]|nr:ROK family transcriptional regulator [Actinomycetales bacterium]